MRALVLPSVCGITNAEDVGEDAFLARAETAIASGLRLIQLREKSWPRERQRALAEALLALAAPRGVKVLLNGDAGDGDRDSGADADGDEAAPDGCPVGGGVEMAVGRHEEDDR